MMFPAELWDDRGRLERHKPTPLPCGRDPDVEDQDSIMLPSFIDLYSHQKQEVVALHALLVLR